MNWVHRVMRVNSMLPLHFLEAQLLLGMHQFVEPHDASFVASNNDASARGAAVSDSTSS